MFVSWLTFTVLSKNNSLDISSLKDKLETSLNEALEKLEGEEHNASILDTKVAETESKIEELNNKAEELSENIARVSETVHLYFIQRNNLDKPYLRFALRFSCKSWQGAPYIALVSPIVFCYL